MSIRGTLSGWYELKLCPGMVLSGHEEGMYRRALKEGKMAWKENRLVIVKEECKAGEEMEVIRKMVRISKDAPEGSLIARIMESLRASKAM
jgi:hypothetical protein